MKALILAGGKGVRFGLAHRVLPKSLVPLQKKPLLQIVVEDYCSHPDVDEVIVLCGENRQVRNFVNQNKFSKPVTAHLSNKGVLGDILDVKGKIGSEPFFIGTADNLVQVPFPRKAVFEKSGLACLMATTKTSTPEEYTGVEMKGKKVAGIFESPRKSEQRLGAIGKMLFTPSVVQLIENCSFPKHAPIGFLLVLLHQQNQPMGTIFVNRKKVIHITRFSDWWKRANWEDRWKGACVAVRTKIPKRRKRK